MASTTTDLEALVNDLSAENERLTAENAEQVDVIVHLQTDVIELKAENERLRAELTQSRSTTN